MSSSGTVDSLLKELEALVQAGNVEKGKHVLNQLKIAMLEQQAPSVSPQTTAVALELGVLLSVADGDLEAFGRNMAQLEPIYMSGVTTPRKYHVMGLNLMNLLVENRLAEFHSQLELLSDQEASNPLVSFPISLERKLMVGIYDEVLTESIPDPSYQFFMDHLLQTVRDSIADCIEVAYQTLSIKDAAAMMKFQNVSELLEYIQNFRDDWIVLDDNVLTFQPPPTVSAASDIPSMQWIQQSLAYATEMERIV